MGCILYFLWFSFTSFFHPTRWMCPLLSSILFDLPFSLPPRGTCPLLSSILSNPPRRMCSLLSSILFDLPSPIHLEGCVFYFLRFSLTSPVPYTWRDVLFTLFDSLLPPLLIHLEGRVIYSLRFSLTLLLPPPGGMCPLLSAISLTSPPHPSWWKCILGYTSRIQVEKCFENKSKLLT